MDLKILIVGALILSALFQIVLFWFKIRKPKKVKRSQDAFDSVKDEKCICDKPCNEFCNGTFKI